MTYKVTIVVELELPDMEVYPGSNDPKLVSKLVKRRLENYTVGLGWDLTVAGVEVKP